MVKMEIDQQTQEDSTAGTRQEIALSQRLRFWRRNVEKHLLAIALTTLLVGAIAAFVAFSQEPIYRATTTLYIEPTKSKLVSIEDVYSGISGSREHLHTQAEILKSRELAAKLVKRLKLATHPAIAPRQAPRAWKFSIPWRDWIPAEWLTVAAPLPLSEDPLTDAAIRAVSSSLDVQLVRNSILIKVSFESTDRNLAATMANTMGEVYIENDLEARLEMTQRATSWLSDQLKELKQNVEASEVALQQFRDREKILDAKGIALGASGELISLTTTLVAARQKAAELENAYRQVQAVLKGESRTTLESLPAVIRSGNVTKVKELETEAERRLAELGKRYGPEHPRMIAAESDLRLARENARNAVDSVVTTITREYEVAKATEQTMQESLEKSKIEIRNIGRKEFQLAALERDAQANRQLYEMFINRFKETKIAGDFQSTIARVIDPAIVPSAPVRPKKTLIITVCLVIGLMLGVALAFLLESLDNGVHSTEDVATKLQVPLLGIVPEVRARHGKLGLQRAFIDDIDPAFCESIRTLRIGLLMSALDNPHKVVLVTSAVPEEGKTLVAINLAFALAQVKRTCLVDADMRRPLVHKVMGGETNMPGLSNLVAGTETMEKCIHQHESGLFYLPAGPIPPNPSELLSSKRFADVLAKLGESFDIVMIDSAPVKLVSDAVILSGLANALIFVVRADATPHQVAKGALELLKRGKAQLVGVVLNKLDMEKAERYHGYGGNFSYDGKYKHYQSYGYYGAKK